MPVPADSVADRFVADDPVSRPWLRVAASPWWAKVLVAAGAHQVPQPRPPHPLDAGGSDPESLLSTAMALLRFQPDVKLWTTLALAATGARSLRIVSGDTVQPRLNPGYRDVFDVWRSGTTARPTRSYIDWGDVGEYWARRRDSVSWAGSLWVTAENEIRAAALARSWRQLIGSAAAAGSLVIAEAGGAGKSVLAHWMVLRSRSDSTERSLENIRSAFGWYSSVSTAPQDVVVLWTLPEGGALEAHGASPALLDIDALLRGGPRTSSADVRQALGRLEDVLRRLEPAAGSDATELADRLQASLDELRHRRQDDETP